MSVFLNYWCLQYFFSFNFYFINVDIVPSTVVLLFKDTTDFFSISSPVKSVYLQNDGGSYSLDVESYGDLKMFSFMIIVIVHGHCSQLQNPNI